MKAAEASKKLQEARDRLTNPIDYLNAKFPGRGIFRYVQTHPDMDHMAGIHRLFVDEKIPLANFWDTQHCIEKDEVALRSGKVNREIKDWHTYLRLRASTTDPTVLRLKAGDTRHFWADDGIEIWAPLDQRHARDSDADPNGMSYVLFIRFGKCNIVLGGDATEATWGEIYDAREGKFPKINLLKASHHGRKSGYHLETIKAMNPDVTIMSVGDLKDKHDASGSYERFSNKGCHSTLEHGDIIAKCWSDGEVWLHEKDGSVFLKSFK